MYYMVRTSAEYNWEPTATKVCRLKKKSLPAGLKFPFQVSLKRNPSYQFPLAMFCSHIWLDMKKARSLDLSKEALRYSLGYFDNFHRPTLPNASKHRLRFLSFYNEHPYPSLPEFCKNITTNLTKTTSPSEFAKITDPAYLCTHCSGQSPVRKVFSGDNACYSFSLADIKGGLGSPEVLVYLKIKHTSASLYSENFPIWHLYFPQNQYFEPGLSPTVMAEPYVHNLIKITVQEFSAIPKPEAPCKDEISESYSSLDCMAKCENRLYQETFNCSLWLTASNLPNEPSRFCNFNDPYVNGTFADFFETSEAIEFFENASSACFDECPEKCKRTVFEASIVSKVDIVDADYRHIAETVRLQNMSLIVAQFLHSAVQDGGVVRFEESRTYTFVALVSNIGGTLGLFVGGTLLTLAQILVILARYMARYVLKFLNLVGCDKRFVNY